MIQEHAAAVLTLLASVPAHDGKVPDGTNPSTSPYVLVRFDDTSPEEADNRPLTGTSQRFVLRILCYCVGGSQQAARIIADRVRTALLDVAPTVSGRTCAPIRSEDGGPDEEEPPTGTGAWERLAIYRLESVPA